MVCWQAGCIFKSPAGDSDLLLLSSRSSMFIAVCEFSMQCRFDSMLQSYLDVHHSIRRKMIYVA